MSKRDEEIPIPTTPSQEEYIYVDEPFPALVAGLGSGKTEAGIMRVLKLMGEDSKANCGFYLPTYDLLRRRAMPGFEEVLDRLKWGYTSNYGSYTIKVKKMGEIVFRSFDRPERIVAYEVAHSVIDELDTIKKEKAELVWRKVTERNRQRSKRKNSVGVVTTPDQGLSGFVYSRWGGTKLAPGFRLIRGKTTDNPFLPEGYVEQIRSNYDPILADLYINGEFVSLSRNKVYHCYDKIKNDTNREVMTGDHLHVGLDFNIGGTCASVYVIEGKIASAVDEFVSHDTVDFINKLISRYPDHRKTVYPDATGGSSSTSSSQSDIALIMQAGLRVDAPRSNPVVRDRVNAVNGALSHSRLMINSIKCPKLVEALETQGYDKWGYPEKFDAHPSIDDWVDGLGYFMDRRFPVSKPIITTGVRSVR